MRKEEQLSKAAAELGRRGGKAGTGKSKVRGNKKYYSDIAKKRWNKEGE